MQGSPLSDLRLATIDGKGPIIGAYLTRPTSAAEIRREAGVFSIGSVRILVGSALVPLAEEDVIQVQHGCLIRLVRHEYAIEPVRSLAQALQHEPFEGMVGPFCRVPTVRPLMLLHRSGKFIFSSARPGGAPLHTAIINFVGVPAGSVSFHSPGDGDLERLLYRGTNVRNVLALADLQPGAEADYVLFLDLRPMAASVQFVCLAQPWIGHQGLAELLPRSPPPGWRIGGRVSRQRIKFTHRSTLVVGFVRDDDLFDLPSSSSSSAGSEEDEEEEDSHLDDHSLSSTRSRSRPGLAQDRRSASSDRSYQGNAENAPATDAGGDVAKDGALFDVARGLSEGLGWTCTAKGILEGCQRTLVTEGLGFFDDPLSMLSCSPHVCEFGPCAELWKELDVDVTACCVNLPLFSYVGISCSGPVICRVPEMPWLSSGRSVEVGSLDKFAGHALFPGERLEPGLPAPIFERPAPETVDGFAPVVAAYQATALIFVPEYAPECVTASLRVGMTVSEAIAAFASARSNERAEHFAALIPAHPQPTTGFATFVSVASWSEATYVLIDFLRYNGTMFCSHVPPAVDLETLRALVSIPADMSLEIFVGDHPVPLAPGVNVQVEAGTCVHFVPAGHPPFAVAYLTDMLLSSEGWLSGVQLPVHQRRWLYLVSDNEPGFLEILDARRLLLKADIADRFQYERSETYVTPSEPRIADYFDYGALAKHVFIATQRPPRSSRSLGALCPYILDLRPIHCGITWDYASRASVEDQGLVDRFSTFCPHGLLASVSGGSPRHEDDGLYLDLVPGSVLVVTFRAQLVDSSDTGAEASSEDSDSDESSDPGSSADSDQIMHDGAPLIPCLCPAEEGETHSRSRSPPSRAGEPRSAENHSDSVWSVVSRTNCHCNRSRVDKWVDGLSQHVPPLGIRWLTSVLLLLRQLSQLFAVSVLCCGFLFARLVVQATTRHAGGCRPCYWGVMLVLCLCFSQVQAMCSDGDQRTSIRAASSSSRAFELPYKVSSCAVVSGNRRPLPTPCRRSLRVNSLPLPADPVRGDSLLHLENRGLTVSVQTADEIALLEGQTVLDSVSESERAWAYFEAATLVDTLFEHFGNEPLPMQCHLLPDVKKVVLLEQTLPVTDFQQQALSLLEILSGCPGIVRPEELTDWLDNDVKSLFLDPAVPVNKRGWFRQVCRWHCVADTLCPESLVVYTDGSSSSGVAAGVFPGAWAFSVWVVAHGSEYLLGHASDICVTAPGLCYVGAEADTPLVCEQLAIVWALAWIVQFGPSLQLAICLKFDCHAAGYGAFGFSCAPCSPGSAHFSALSSFACHLRQLAGLRVQLSHAHVKAHSGHVGNELCDELAKRARRNDSARAGDLLPLWPGQLFLHPLKAWAWVPPQGSHDLPALFAFESEAFRLQAQDPVGESGPCLGLRSAHPRKRPSRFTFRLLTVNILTLLDPGSSRLGEASCALQGLRVVAKRELIKSQLLREKILLAGLQETRLRDTATLPDSHFVMRHSSADDKGHYGVGLWANTMEAYAHSDDQQWFLQRGHFTVLVCQPRLLVAQICAPFLRLTVVVAHAPSEVRGNEGTAAAFWSECRAALSRRVKDSEVVVLTDANARIGSLTSEAVGPCWAETETSAGQAFHQFVAEEILKVPATFDECQEGPGYTWTSPVGLKHRIDYVCVPSTWPLSGIRTFVWGDFESMQLRDDHFPSVLHADFASRAGSDTSARYMRSAARPVGVVASDAYLCSLQAVAKSPPLAWSTGVDAHYSHLAREWVQLGKNMGEPTVRQPRQLYLSATTLRLVAWRKAWRQQLRTWSLQTRCRTLAYCWIAWRALCQGIAPSPPEALRLSLWVSQMLPDIAQAAMLVFRMGRQLKRLARQDRLDYLDGLAANVSLADMKDSKTLYRRVRQVFCGLSLRPEADILPAPCGLGQGRTACQRGRC